MAGIHFAPSPHLRSNNDASPLYYSQYYPSLFLPPLPSSVSPPNRANPRSHYLQPLLSALSPSSLALLLLSSCMLWRALLTHHNSIGFEGVPGLGEEEEHLRHILVWRRAVATADAV